MKTDWDFCYTTQNLKKKFQCFKYKGCFCIIFEWVQKWQHLFAIILYFHENGSNNFVCICVYTNWTGHILWRNCLLKHITEGKIEGGTEVTGRRCNLLLDDLEQMWVYWKLKEDSNKFCTIFLQSGLLYFPGRCLPRFWSSTMLVF
jgi:hypothetical protein